MNERVYLHEFDCSMMSEKETLLASKRLYEELVLKGNIVVLSYFEVLDSPSFFRLYSKYKEQILTLFSCGRLLINSYSDKYTPLQCVLEKIRSCENEEVNDLFAVLDNELLKTKTKLKDEYIRYDEDKDKHPSVLQLLAKALEYNDSEIFIRYDLVDKECNTWSVNLINYVDMVISISSIKGIVIKEKSNLPNEYRFNMEQLFDRLLVNDNIIYNNELYPLFSNINSLRKNVKNFNTREDWYKIFAYVPKENAIEEITYKSRTVIDVLYNMVVENSILNINEEKANLAKDDSAIYKEFIDKYKLHLSDITNRIKTIQNYNFLTLTYRKDEKIKNFEYAAYIFDTYANIENKFEECDWLKQRTKICFIGLGKSFGAILSFIIGQLLVGHVLNQINFIPTRLNLLISIIGGLILDKPISILLNYIYEKLGVKDGTFQQVFKSIQYLFKSIFCDR